MYHTISNIDNAIILQQYIDNKNNNKRIGLKFIRYSLGWHNIIGCFFNKEGEKSKKIEKGYYSFQQLSDEFKKENIIIDVNESNGIASLITPKRLKMQKDLRNMLGFKNKKNFEPTEIHYGNKIVNLAPYKELYIYLEQVSTANNFLNGFPSKLLTVVPVENKEFGDTISVRFENPEYKDLVCGEITELKLEIRDKKNNKIKNHLPLNCVLEII